MTRDIQVTFAVTQERFKPQGYTCDWFVFTGSRECDSNEAAELTARIFVLAAQSIVERMTGYRPEPKHLRAIAIEAITRTGKIHK